MAVTIIEEGTKEAPTYTRVCPECGCKYTYQWSDTIWNNNCGGFREATCPQCGYPVAHIMGGSSEMNEPILGE